MESQTILFRPHRGGLDDSMTLTKEVKSKTELLALLKTELESLNLPKDVTESRISTQHQGFDSRTGWETHLLLLDGTTPLGYTNNSLENL